ncbi:hypothetical protein LH407_05765 [Antiquaquibacter oligotrophicus]|nr:hypothetical protein [Antiquaquibacter oligotrophicus]UDF14368.1 hypothetical protein LH407_05765 [Antiquaquibacter oligotrophicus]
MRVLLKFTLDCTPDAAWRALRDPKVVGQVDGPIAAPTSLEPGGFPDEWTTEPHRVAVKAFGLIPIGEQEIRLSFSERAGARIVQDTGRPLSGALATVTSWRHTMAVSPRGDGRTLYRDRLEFGAGLLTPAVWPVLWALWQWRGAQLKRLAPTWE